jgi:biotin operon repressor
MSEVELSENVTREEVHASIQRTKSSLMEAAKQIVWQIQNKTWRVLGYATWDEMREAEYGGAAVRLSTEERLKIVPELAREGLSQKVIGETLGVSQEQIGRDIRALIEDGVDIPNTRKDSLGRERPSSYKKRKKSKEFEDESDEFEDSEESESNGETIKGTATVRKDEVKRKKEDSEEEFDLPKEFYLTLRDVLGFVQDLHSLTRKEAFRENAEGISKECRPLINGIIAELNDLIVCLPLVQPEVDDE